MSARRRDAGRPDAGRTAPERPSPVALAALVAANLVPLAGVGWLGWSAVEVVLVYWVESGVIGLLNLPRILLAAGAPAGRTDRATGAPARTTVATRIGAAAFFCVHYGAFWLGHFLLIVAVFGSRPAPAGAAADASASVFALSVASLVLSHAAAFALHYVGRREYRAATPGAQMWRPYPRVVVLHLGLLAGGALLDRFGSPAWGLVAFVALKTAADAAALFLGHTPRTGAAPRAFRAAPGGR